MLTHQLSFALDVEPVDRGMPRRRSEKTAEDADECRLTGAIGAEEAEDLAAGDLQRDAVERADRAEILRHILDVDADLAVQSTRPFTPKSTSAAIPAFNFASGSTSTFTPKTCSARCARVCTLRGVYSPWLLTLAT